MVNGVVGVSGMVGSEVACLDGDVAIVIGGATGVNPIRV